MALRRGGTLGWAAIDHSGHTAAITPRLAAKSAYVIFYNRLGMLADQHIHTWPSNRSDRTCGLAHTPNWF